MKIGIMGGTFHPIHNGHLMLAKTAKEQFGLDNVWFMPNRIPPHKEIDDTNEMTQHRVKMVELAIQPYDDFVLQPYEIENTEVSYSYKTLEHFKETYPNDTFYFIIGADSLFAFENWVYPQRIADCCVILAAVRDEKKEQDIKEQIFYLNEKFHADIRYLNMPNIEISSTDIRTCAADLEKLLAYVPRDVADYINEHQLFQGEH